MSNVRGQCPRCQEPLTIPQDWLGRQVKCRHCGAVVRAARAPAKDALFPDLRTAPAPVAPPKRFAPIAIVLTAMAVTLIVVGGVAYAVRDRQTAPPNPVSATDAHTGKNNSVVQVVEPSKSVEPLASKSANPGKAPMPPTSGGNQNPSRNQKSKAKGPPTKVTPPAEPKYPRRMLAISINHYLYANPIHFGSNRRNVNAVIDRFVNRFHIPADQAILVTDVQTSRGSVPPTKPVITGAIESFLATSRPQDQIVLLYAGHALVADGKCYLVPLEGELSDVNSLIPLDWLFERLATCLARQRVLIFDACRIDPSRGSERPSPGPMAPELEKALKSAPVGVQVWASCSAGEHSYEFKSQKFDGNEIAGGLFLNQILTACQQGINLDSKPNEPIPIAKLAEKVDPLTTAAAKSLQKQPQTPWLAGIAPAGGATFDPKAPAPGKVVVPKAAPGGAADRKLIAGIFDEIRIPPTKATSLDGSGNSDADLPFAAQALHGYQPDYTGVRELLDNPEKYPLRVAVLNVVAMLNRHALGKVRVAGKEQVAGLIEEYASPNNDTNKRRILESQRTGPANMLLELDDAMQSLDKVKMLRNSETKRWQANYDYVLARLKCRLAYITEYNLMLGKIRKDELPPLDPALHRGWRLASAAKMQSAGEAKELVEEARELFDRLIMNHPGTPWEVLARRDRLSALGLTWQPAAK